MQQDSRLRHVNTDDSKRDKSYRRYASGIERTLALIDSAPLEWPDYISFLGRLLKAIQAHSSPIDSLPHKSAVAHRLSQCLTPALPSGVHQKALEVYACIFELIGIEGLGRDLAVFLPGLSSVLSFASLSLHPVFLDIIQKHVLRLSPYALRPALRALILCILPGLEDDTSEEFERALSVVDTARESTVLQPPEANEDASSTASDEYFWQCFFLAAIGSRSRRPGALAYLSRRLPKLGSSTATNGNAASGLEAPAKAVVSPEPGLLIRCFAVGLQDDQPLTQRGFLDLLLTHLPLNSPVLTSMVNARDLETLTIAAVTVVTRRDMSLNRRLWAWFLGPESGDDEDEGVSAPSSLEAVKPAQQSANAIYFEQHGLKPLASGLLAMFKQDVSTPAAKARPYRICLSLLDRAELGAPLVSRLFVPAMRNAFSYQRTAADSDAQEVLRSANSFFDGIESGIIWGEILGLIQKGFDTTADAEALESMLLVKFILTSFNVREEEMLIFHMPSVCLALLTLINASIASAREGLSSTFFREALLVADKMITYFPERAKLNDSFSSSDPKETSGQHIRASIAKFYQENQGNVALSPPPFSSRQTASLLLRESASNVRLALLAQTEGIDILARELSSLISKVPRDEALDANEIIQASRLVLDHDDRSQLSFTTLSSIVQVLAHAASYEKLVRDIDKTGLHVVLTSLVRECWTHLAPTHPRHHVEAMRCLWQIDEIASGARLVEASVSDFLIRPADFGSHRTEMARRFAVFWTHATHSSTAGRKGSAWSIKGGQPPSETTHANREWYHTLHRPLCLLLDGLAEEDTEMKYFLTSWLTSLPNIEIILDMIFQTELENVRRLRMQLSSLLNDSASKLQAQHHDTTPQCLYFMRHLNSLLKLNSNNVWTAMSRINTMPDAAEDGDLSNQVNTFDSYIARQCLRIIRLRPITGDSQPSRDDITLQCTCLSVMRQLMRNPEHSAILKLGLEVPLIDILREYLARGTKEPSLQIALLDTILASLKLKRSEAPSDTPLRSPTGSQLNGTKSVSHLSLPLDDPVHFRSSLKSVQPPKQLVNCIQEGIGLASSFYVLEHWIQFLIDVLPLFAGNLFQNLIPLVECICRQITVNFQALQGAFRAAPDSAAVPPDSSLLALLEGLEHVLSISHDQLAVEEARAQSIKSPEPSQGFFGNVVSGVFNSEVAKTGRATANTRLTVLLCFQDAVRICLSIWSWGTYHDDKTSKNPTVAASFVYSSTRLRNRARRILDRVFAIEPLECLETIIATWCRPGEKQPGLSALKLLHALDASQPKVTMPATFNAIYSRTNPAALETSRVSSMTSDLSVFELGRFLLDYTQSLDDDAMDEVWNDCMTFLKDVLSNPLPHSHILPCLLIFLITLAEKVENTNFGEQRKIRKDLSDLFMKVLTATMTTRSAASLSDPALAMIGDDDAANGTSSTHRASVGRLETMDVLEMLSLVVPKLDTILTEPDKQLSAAASISAAAITPSIASKQFPESLRSSQLTLLQLLSRVPSAAKVWRKDVSEIFSHARLFSCPLPLVRSGILPLLRSWALVEKERLPELLSKMTAPTSAGIMFGVGASAARLEADKRTQLTLRRIALLLLAAPPDTALTSYQFLEEKMTELLNATPASSPSSTTRAEVFMVLQAVVLRTSAIHLASLWPMIRLELQRAIGSTLARSPEYETYNVPALLQACRLLDLLLISSPDDFQLHQWLFVTDTIDAVYRPEGFEAVSLVDDLVEEMGTSTSVVSPTPATPATASRLGFFHSDGGDGEAAREAKMKQPLLRVPGSGDVSRMAKDEFAGTVLKPFFASASIGAFEAVYGMGPIDWPRWEEQLLADLFEVGTLVG